MTRTTPETAFLDLVLADEDLLRGEFEAIVAASWQDPPPPPAGPRPGDHPPGWPVARAAARILRPAPAPVRRRRGRQRAPPPIRVNAR